MTTLPWLTTGALVEQGGDPVEDADEIGCSVWPATSTSTSTTGRHHTHRGEAEYAYAEALRVANRSLVVDGETYRIVSATPMSMVRHVVLELLLTSARS